MSFAIGLQRDIVVVTAATNGSTFARKYPSQPPPVEKISGGIFIPMSTEILCNQWQQWKPTPLLIVFNDINHYDSTLCILLYREIYFSCNNRNC